MKLVLKGFSQEIEVANLTEAANYLVFEDEDSGQPFRLPVLQETITALSGIIVGDVPDIEDPEGEALIQQYGAPPPSPPTAPPPTRKTLRGPRSEDEVAPL